MAVEVFLSVAGAGAKTGVDIANAYSLAEIQNAFDDTLGGGPGSKLYIQEGTYTLSTYIDCDAGAGLGNSYIQIIGVNSSWVDDGTRPILDGNSTATYIIYLDGGCDRTIFKNLELINATSTGFRHTNSGNSDWMYLQNVIIENNGSHGIDGQNNMSGGGIYCCQIRNNVGTGINEWRSVPFDNVVLANNNIGTNSIDSGVSNSLIYGNTSQNLRNMAYVVNCIVDGYRTGTNTPYGIISGSSILTLVSNCRITNHSTYGISNLNTSVLGNNNYYYNNTVGDIENSTVYFYGYMDRLSGVNNSDGYKNVSIGDYNLTAGGDGVGVEIPIGSTNEGVNFGYLTQGIPPKYGGGRQPRIRFHGA